jgi:hypothetical protein
MPRMTFGQRRFSGCSWNAYEKAEAKSRLDFGKSSKYANHEAELLKEQST